MSGKLGLRLSHAEDPFDSEEEARPTPSTPPSPPPREAPPRDAAATEVANDYPPSPQAKASSSRRARKAEKQGATLHIAPEAPIELAKPKAPELVQRPKRSGGGYTILANGEERRKINCMIAADVGEALYKHAKSRGSKESWVLERILREYYGMQDAD